MKAWELKDLLGRAPDDAVVIVYRGPEYPLQDALKAESRTVRDSDSAFPAVLLHVDPEDDD